MRYSGVSSWDWELPSYNIQDVERSEYQLGNYSKRNLLKILPGIALVVTAIWLVYIKKAEESRAA